MSIYSWHLLQPTPGAFCLWYLMTPFFLDWNPQELSPTLDNNDIGLWLYNYVLFTIYALRMYGTFILHHQWYSEFPLLTPLFWLTEYFMCCWILNSTGPVNWFPFCWRNSFHSVDAILCCIFYFHLKFYMNMFLYFKFSIVYLSKILQFFRKLLIARYLCFHWSCPLVVWHYIFVKQFTVK